MARSVQISKNMINNLTFAFFGTIVCFVTESMSKIKTNKAKSATLMIVMRFSPSVCANIICNAPKNNLIVYPLLSAIFMKSTAFKLAPPISTPSTQSSAKISALFDGFTLPP